MTINKITLKNIFCFIRNGEHRGRLKKQSREKQAEVGARENAKDIFRR